MAYDAMALDVEEQQLKRPQWPVIEELPAEQAQLLSLPMSNHDEVSIKGTYAVHKDTFLNFLQLNRDTDFGERLWITVSDQTTVERIRSIRAESVESAKPFDKRSFILAVPAWFHILMNCGNTLLRTYWNNNQDGESLAHCLSEDARFWSLKGVSEKKPKFYLIQSLIFRSYRARVTALFLQEMTDRQLFLDAPAELDRIDAAKQAMAELTL